MTTAIATVPVEARARYPELMRALEEAYPVRFVGSSESEIAAAGGVIVFPGGSRPERLHAPCLVLEAPDISSGRGSPFSVEMSRCVGLDRPLHGQRLVEEGNGPPAAASVERGGQVLAIVAGRPVWTRRGAQNGEGGCEYASATPAELADHEFLRDHLTAGRFWSLLPLVHFLKRVSVGPSDGTHSQRACFVIDDPNVRFASYGHVRFPELARDARECGYHVAVATIPLDLLLPGQRGVEVFRKHRSELSVVVHGNDHVYRELERDREAAEADRMIRSAIARVRRFESRAGIRVERVMCPPHGGCGPATLAALFRCGFLALAASRAFPWDSFSDHRRWRLGRWLPAQLAGGGLPVLPRHPLSGSLDDLVFRALLDQPLIMYCHHADLRGGLDLFRAAAARVAELGDVRWMSVASIAGTNATCRVENGVAAAGLYSRDVRIRRPPTSMLRIDIPRIFGADTVRLVVDDTAQDVEVRPDVATSITIPNDTISGELRLRIDALHPVAEATVREWRPRAWPLARRAMTETRDRAMPRIRELFG